MMENRCVYLVSGPPGVGKISVSRKLAYKFDKSAIIEGDYIYLMVRAGVVAPWDDDGYFMDLFWDNVLDITENFLDRNITVIIEYVLFKEQLSRLHKFLKERNIALKYCVLLSDEKTLAERDLLRNEHERTGDLSLKSRKEFLDKNIDDDHILYTDELSIDEVVDIIIDSERFILK